MPIFIIITILRANRDVLPPQRSNLSVRSVQRTYAKTAGSAREDGGEVDSRRIFR